MDSNHRRAVPSRFTVCPLWPLGYASKEHFRCCSADWSRHPESNRGPTVYKTVALPLSYAGGRAGKPRLQNSAGRAPYSWSGGECSRCRSVWQAADAAVNPATSARRACARADQVSPATASRRRRRRSASSEATAVFETARQLVRQMKLVDERLLPRGDSGERRGHDRHADGQRLVELHRVDRPGEGQIAEGDQRGVQPPEESRNLAVRNLAEQAHVGQACERRHLIAGHPPRQLEAPLRMGPRGGGHRGRIDPRPEGADIADHDIPGRRRGARGKSSRATALGSGSTRRADRRLLARRSAELAVTRSASAIRSSSVRPTSSGASGKPAWRSRRS